MKRCLIILFVLLVKTNIGVSQQVWLNRIKKELSMVSHDTSKVFWLSELSNYYKLKRPDSTLFYGYKALRLAREIEFPRGEARALTYISIAYRNLGNDSKALQIILDAKSISEKYNLHFNKAYVMLAEGDVYLEMENYRQALNIYKEANWIFDSLKVLQFIDYSNNLIGETFLEMNLIDSAYYYCLNAYSEAIRRSEPQEIWTRNPILINLGKIQNKKGGIEKAMDYFKQSLSVAIESNNFFNSNYAIAQQYLKLDMLDSSIYYAKQSLEVAEESGYYINTIKASLLLTSLYELDDPQQALIYSKRAISYNDSLTILINTTLQKTFTDFDNEERQREIDMARQESTNRIRMNAFLGSSFTLLMIAILLYRNNRQKQRSKRKVEIAYERLKNTQSQLIQSEKMASLGELTAGIAHEIQNPLNFVNNFSEVNTELIDELDGELTKGNIDEIKEITKDLRENELKIKHHGQRAESIVKGMLQHSRITQGEYVPTDINALADEYLRLAYHGLRAKDKSFNADFKTDLDPSLPNIEVVPQDIGRVLLNLINNAFYAVDKKAKHGLAGYKPEVFVSTKLYPLEEGVSGVKISVKDNGSGIPEDIKDKIFQPFFTTKPTGSGTGLGLSLSYDIIKAHGGQLYVESHVISGTVFVIKIPITS